MADCDVAGEVAINLLPQQSNDHNNKSNPAAVRSSCGGGGNQEIVCCQKCWDRFYLSDLGLILLLVIYTICGAAVIYLLEAPFESNHHQKLMQENRDKARIISENITEFCFYQPGNFSFNQTVCELYLARILEERYALAELEPKWTIAGSILFVTTTYSTIGFGNITPVTTYGRAFSIIYNCLGIPLFLLILTRLGHILSKIICFLWWKLRSILCGRMMIKDDLVKKIAVERRDFPITVLIILTLALVFICSCLFLIYEPQWSYFTAFYFSFVTLTTIGYGDVLPSNNETMVVLLGLILIGLSLISMCIAMIQEKLELYYQSLLKSINITYQKSLVDDEYEMDPESLNKLFKKEGRWMLFLLGKYRKLHLISEWKHRARMRIKETQTDLKAVLSIGVQHPSEISKRQHSSEFNLRDLQHVDDRPRLHSSSLQRSGDFGKLHSLLNDCRVLLKKKDHLDQVKSNSETAFDSNNS